MTRKEAFLIFAAKMDEMFGDGWRSDHKIIRRLKKAAKKAARNK